MQQLKIIYKVHKGIKLSFFIKKCIVLHVFIGNIYRIKHKGKTLYPKQTSKENKTILGQSILNVVIPQKTIVSIFFKNKIKITGQKHDTKSSQMYDLIRFKVFSYFYADRSVFVYSKQGFCLGIVHCSNISELYLDHSWAYTQEL